VIDVASQEYIEQAWTLKQWAAWYSDPARKLSGNCRRRALVFSSLSPLVVDSFAGAPVLNVISFEVTGTPLGEQVEAPTVVRQLDWVQTVWPKSHKATRSLPTDHVRYPQVRAAICCLQRAYNHAWSMQMGKFCLMSAAGAFTAGHVDAAGTSVFYHVLSGRKTFLLTRPTERNLEAFEVGVGQGRRARS